MGWIKAERVAVASAAVVVLFVFRAWSSKTEPVTSAVTLTSAVLEPVGCANEASWTGCQACCDRANGGELTTMTRLRDACGAGEDCARRAAAEHCAENAVCEAAYRCLAKSGCYDKRF